MQPRPEPEPEQEPGPEPEPVLRPGLSLPLPLPGVALLEWSASSGAGTRNTTSSARSRSRRGVQSSKTRSQNSHETGQKRPRDEQGGMELARDIAEIFCAAAVDPRSTALPVAKLQFIEKHVSALVRDGRYQGTASDSCLWWRGPVVGNRRVTNRIRTKGLRSVCFMLHFNELGEGRVRASPLCVLRVREELLARGGARGPAQTAPGAPRTPTRSSSGARTPSELPVEHSLHQGTPSRKCRKPGESPRGKKLFVRNTCMRHA
jgi:hypothetical protein